MGMSDPLDPARNEDREIWRKEIPGRGESIHVTKNGMIGINVGGHAVIMSVEKWHQCGLLRLHLETLMKPQEW